MPARSTVVYSQTNFILLFLLLLMKKHSDKKFSGILLALAFFTKPYMLIFGLYFLIRKQWKPIIYCIATTLILVGFTILVYGIEPFITYIYDNPIKRYPSWIQADSMHQSLNAVLIRSHLTSINNPSVYYYIAISILILTVFYLFYLAGRKLYDSMWAVLLLVGLMLYPGTIYYYGVLILFIIFQFFDEKRELGFNMYLTIPIIAIFYILSGFYLFICFCFLLIILILKSFNLISLPNLKFYKSLE
jgi:hypothetical protein